MWRGILFTVSFILLSPDGVVITPLDVGVHKHEDGVVVTKLPIIPRVVHLKFPCYEQLLPKLYEQIEMPPTMKPLVMTHVANVGRKMDLHTKSTMTLWH